MNVFAVKPDKYSIKAYQSSDAFTKLKSVDYAYTMLRIKKSVCT